MGLLVAGLWSWFTLGLLVALVVARAARRNEFDARIHQPHLPPGSAPGTVDAQVGDPAASAPIPRSARRSAKRRVELADA